MKGSGEASRFREIVAVLIKHGIQEGLKGIQDPVQWRMALEELGPTFVKIGQILSSRPDLLSEPFLIEFQKLQNHVKPESSDNSYFLIQQEFGLTPAELFDYFEPEPFASASLAVVHRGRLKTGENVAIKVQRKGVREIFLRDIQLLRRLTRFLRPLLHSQVINPQEVVDELRTAAEKELDFLSEASNLKIFRHNHSDEPSISAPIVYDALTTSKVLTMEYIDGITSMSRNTLLQHHYDPDHLATTLADNYFKQVLADGFFHGDPHPGNFLIRKNQIVYIDFGQVGVLSSSMQKKLNYLLLGIAGRNIEQITQAVLSIGIRRGEVNSMALHSDLERLFNRYIDQPISDIELTSLLDELLFTARKNQLAMPSEFTMMLKGMMTLEGVLADLAPKIQLMDIAIPYSKKHLLAEHTWKDELQDHLQAWFYVSRHLPRLPVKLTEVMNQALAGKLTVQMEHRNLEKSISALQDMVNRLVLSILIAALIVGSSIVINAEAGPTMRGISLIGFLGYAGSAVIGTWLIIAILRSYRKK
ncbi:ABC1 kinase family protein [Tindallia californiensis]|uniref:Ubiquinone biosynthesis protein n=1 Tax=Tindallia californiensis TaxID=159292 RepID=A0A1H3MVB8_9FIRM|nr:AarF/UbiB family protein [Tindallia californiensis]SDY80444.1 ubiquinone biosynthesis protein [Tindallia californiensis]